MGKIAVLDKQTIDKIAAGEVVERPASVAKELVENAIDAGATQITVEIQEGGIGFLRITDNGSGIEKEDIPLAFFRHSTSKIKTAEDLFEICSLGFRGEALSSISAVSKVELISKTRTNVLGCRYCIEGGIEKSLEEIAAVDGTTFIVRNLFYNVPARKKFLKSETTEAAAIHEMMTHLALSHPQISFKVLINQQLRIQTTGNGKLKDVIYQIYGREVAMQLLEVDYEDGFVKVHGFIGKPEISRGNRNYENYFVNGRFVKSQLLIKAIEDAYKPFLSQHRYPFVCLNLQLNSKDLDVNVHPAKLELRFSKENEVYKELNKAIAEALPKVEGMKSFQNCEEAHFLKEETNYQTKTQRPKEKPLSQIKEQMHLFEEKLLPKGEKVKYQFIGQLFDSYCLVQFEDKLYIIDQYAACEKVLYKEFMCKLQNKACSSWLLTAPIVLNLSMKEEQLYLNYQTYFRDLGFEIEDFGERTYMVRAVPMDLQALANKSLLLELINNLSNFLELKNPQIVLDKIAFMSCKVAVKGKYKTKMSKADARRLIDKFLTLENPQDCFDGKPIMISITKQELEKKMGKGK